MKLEGGAESLPVLTLLIGKTTGKRHFKPYVAENEAPMRLAFLNQLQGD